MKAMLGLLLLLPACGEDVVCPISSGGCDDLGLSPVEVSMEFGEVEVGSERFKTFKVEARGRIPRTVSLHVPAPFRIEPARASVQAGMPAEFVVHFAPTAPGRFDVVVPGDVTLAFHAVAVPAS
jgi:uncharacterized protein (DUF58 family)